MPVKGRIQNSSALLKVTYQNKANAWEMLVRAWDCIEMSETHAQCEHNILSREQGLQNLLHGIRLKTFDWIVKFKFCLCLHHSISVAFFVNRLEPQETSLNSFAVFFMLEPNVISGKVGVKDRKALQGDRLFSIFEFRSSFCQKHLTPFLFSFLIKPTTSCLLYH